MKLSCCFLGVFVGWFSVEIVCLQVLGVRKAFFGCSAAERGNHLCCVCASMNCVFVTYCHSDMCARNRLLGCKRSMSGHFSSRLREINIAFMKELCCWFWVFGCWLSTYVSHWLPKLWIWNSCRQEFGRWPIGCRSASYGHNVHLCRKRTVLSLEQQ